MNKSVGPGASTTTFRKETQKGLIHMLREVQGPLIISGSLSVEIGLAMAHFVSKVWHLKKGSGLLATALYLKKCSVALQRFYTESLILKEPLSVPVSLTMFGLHRFIPSYHIKIIHKKDDRANRLVKLYLSWFGLPRIVELAKHISKATFLSIITPTKDIGMLKGVLGLVKEYFPKLQKRYIPWISTVPLEKGIKLIPTWKSTLMDGRSFLKGWCKTTRKKLDLPMPGSDAPVNQFSNLKHEITAFAWNVNKIHSIQDGVFSPGILFQKRTLFAIDKMNTTFVNLDLDYFERCVGPMSSTLLTTYDQIELCTCQICQTIEGNGKQRLLAIGNYVKQKLMHPVHDWAMSVLHSIPNDRTYDKEAPLHLLRKTKPMDLDSFDLKSATDRWPLSVMHDLMSCFFGPTMGSSIVNGCLGLNTFHLVPLMVNNVLEISFLAGKALRYYGSWALFAVPQLYNMVGGRIELP
ncbi:hypothetical protein Ddye_008718 [Dipteronia dyeriana]|uniref:Uncharacterized protein n=1 Tax=Dipteronia dyeriana TaxID=168575 RepID=A0AAD9XA04_9ROSI|nr:hypothetical protein Ddye_008718 [Dipteronia dyeriana]